MEALISSMIAVGPAEKRPPHILLVMIANLGGADAAPYAGLGRNVGARMSHSITHKSLVVAGLIITGVIAVASIALIVWDPWRPAPEPVAPAAAPAARSGVEKLQWRADPQPAAATPFNDDKGATRTLADFKGRVLVVNFWATWCPPCVHEMPTLDALQAALGGDGFAVVAISQDRGGMGVAKPFHDSHGWSLSLYAEAAGHFARDAALQGLPTSLIVDKQGREVARLEGTAEWNSPEMIAVLRKLMDAP
jgi:thiol-disulfide isomerase/thioredoxin